VAIVLIAAVAKVEKDMFCNGRDSIMPRCFSDEVKDSVKRC
jgi:hypothetical protein